MSRSDKYTYLRKKCVSIWLGATFCGVTSAWAALKALNESAWVIQSNEISTSSHVSSFMDMMEVNDGCVDMT